jgi:hypothetical protein
LGSRIEGGVVKLTCVRFEHAAEGGEVDPGDGDEDLWKQQDEYTGRKGAETAKRSYDDQRGSGNRKECVDALAEDDELVDVFLKTCDERKGGSEREDVEGGAGRPRALRLDEGLVDLGERDDGLLIVLPTSNRKRD